MQEIDPVLIIATMLLVAAALGATAMTAPKNRAAFVYAQLVLMAGVYVGFAVAHIDGAAVLAKGNWSALVTESVLAIGFMLAGLAALQSSRPWLLGVLILIHGAVDLLHLTFEAAHSPDWYAFLCLIYDALVGAAAVWLLSGENEGVA